MLAERAHIAELARRVEVSGPQTDAEYREAFGEEPADLGAMVTHRLGQLGIDAESVQWDSWKDPEGQWLVTAIFNSPLHEATLSRSPRRTRTTPPTWPSGPTIRSGARCAT